jgi:hypothetical protein
MIFPINKIHRQFQRFFANERRGRGGVPLAPPESALIVAFVIDYQINKTSFPRFSEGV